MLSAVAAMSGWASRWTPGVAAAWPSTCGGGVPVAQVIEITTTIEGVKIDKVFVAVDVGTALDPRNLEAQVQSGVIFGLSSALYGEITFAKGAAEQRNFHDYAVLRIRQAPQIAVKVLESGGAIRGIGEIGVPPVAPRWPMRSSRRPESAFVNCRCASTSTSSDGERRTPASP